MKLAMTLLARDEADVVEANLAFHLNAGVDFVVATDHLSSDGTTEILERYARDGYVHVIREDRPEFEESAFITRMARLAATEFGAEWVINSCADEFWWPHGSGLKETLLAVPPRYGAIEAIVRNFVPRPDDDRSFAERMTVRLVGVAPINAPTSIFRPLGKVVHRGSPRITVGGGSHSFVDEEFRLLRGWFPIEVLHFPVRSSAQYVNKAAVYDVSTVDRRLAYRLRRGAAGEPHVDSYRSLVIDQEQLQRGLADGSLVIDKRLRDALHALEDGAGGYLSPDDGAPRLRFQVPTIDNAAACAVEAAVLGEADAVRAQRLFGSLEALVASLERRPVPRAVRLAERTARRLARRGSTERSR